MRVRARVLTLTRILTLTPNYNPNPTPSPRPNPSLAGEGAQQGGLARAIGPAHDEAHAAAQLQAEALEDGLAAWLALG